MPSDRTKALNQEKLLAVPKQCEPPDVTDPQVLHAFDVRFEAATEDAEIPAQPHPRNNDETAYPDKSGTYTKCLKQKAPGVVDPTAFQQFRKAIGNIGLLGTKDFEVPGLLSGPRKLNGPQGAFALQLIGEDSTQFGAPEVPAAPALNSEAYGAELIEIYWASLLRDIPFTGYDSNPLAQAAAKELTNQTTYAGPRDKHGKVTPRLLFRGGLKNGDTSYFAGETIGPYISQFCIRPTNFGARPLDQMYNSYAPNLDYMSDIDTWSAVQQGKPTGLSNLPAQNRQYLHDGRGLAAYTHVDELYQAYFIAYLVMNTLNVPFNPGSPYVGYKDQQPFGTFGGPDITATLGAVAKAALNAVWWQKWVVHLRHRPESGGAIVDFIKTGDGNPQGKVNSNVLNSNAVAQSFDKYQTYFLSQAFPEGSPAHPAYPTGHGTVAGACITVLKFFFDGTFVILDPMVPAPDGLSLEPYNYTSEDGGIMTVNSELHKLAHNISFGHGIHAGIHWRSDTDYSMLLGEAVALGFLRDQSKTYSEKFSISLTKMDGSAATISNP